MQFQKIINDSLCTNNTLCNKKLLKYKGYCLIYNKNDYLTIKINFKWGDILIDRYIKEIPYLINIELKKYFKNIYNICYIDLIQSINKFLKNYELENDDPIYNDIKIKIYFNYTL